MAVTKALSLGKTLHWNAAQVLGLEEISVDYGSRSFVESADLNTALSAPQPGIPALRGPVTITASGFWDKDDTVHAAILADYKAGTARVAKYTRTDGTPSSAEWSIAYIQDLSEPSGSKDAGAKFTVVIRCMGTETEA